MHEKNKDGISQAIFTVVYLKHINFIPMISNLAPSDIVRFITISTAVCRKKASEVSAHLVPLQGSFIFAWREEGNAEVNYYKECSVIFSALKNALLCEGLKVEYSISVARGVCLFESDCGQFKNLLGEVVNVVSRLASRPESADGVALIEQSAMSVWPSEKVEKVADSLYRQSIK